MKNKFEKEEERPAEGAVLLLSNHERNVLLEIMDKEIKDLRHNQRTRFDASWIVEIEKLRAKLAIPS